MKSRDLAGMRFGRLTVIEDSGERKNGYILWRCKCDCGDFPAATNKFITGVLTTAYIFYLLCWMADRQSK